MQHKSAYVWGLLGRFAPQGIHLITTMILARCLTPEDYGKVGVLAIIFTVANVLLDAGLGGSLVKEKKLTSVDCSTIGLFNLIVSVIIYAILFVSADYVEAYFAIEDLSSILRYISLVFPFTALGIVPKALLNRKLAFKETFFNSIVGVIVASVVSVIMAFNGCGVYSLVAYQVVVESVTVICNCITAKYVISFQFSFASLKRLLPFGIYTSLITIIDTVYGNLMTVLIGKYLTVQQAGYMSQAQKIEGVSAASIASAVNIVSFPIMTKLKDDKTSFEKEAMSTISIISSFSFPILMTIAVFSEEVLRILLGSQWIGASNYLQILSFAGMFIIIETLVRNFVKSLCEVKRLLYATIIKRIVGICIIIITFCISSSGIAYGYLMSSIVGFLINLILYTKLMKISAKKIMYKILMIMLPNILYFFIMYFTCKFVYNGEIVKIIVAFIMLLSIYLLYLPLLGISVVDYLKGYIKK